GRGRGSPKAGALMPGAKSAGGPPGRYTSATTDQNADASGRLRGACRPGRARRAGRRAGAGRPAAVPGIGGAVRPSRRQQSTARWPYHDGMTAAHAHELPPEPEGELVLTSEEVRAVERDREIVILTHGGRPVAKVHAIDPDQAWFWTPEWQAKEREVDDERAAGISDRDFASGEEFLAYLEAVIEDPSKL